MNERITPSMMSASTLNDLNAALSALQRSSSELSSGKRILEASDDPYGTSRVIDLQSQLDGLGSYATSVQDGVSWTEAATGAMSNMEEVLQRVRELVVQASNGTNDPSALKSIATVVSQLTENVKQDANTQYAGQYIFSGTTTSTAPYAPGSETDTYKGNKETIARSIGPGANVTISTDISSLLGSGTASADGKLLDVLRTIATHMNEATTESRAALGADLTNLDTNMETLTGLQAQTGSVTNQLQTAAARIETLQTSVSQTLSNTQDADYAKTTIAYSNEQAAYQAALHAGATIVQESLLNFLH